MSTSYQKNIDKTEIEKLSLFVFPGEVVVIENAADAEEAVKSMERVQFLGFDTETRPAFQKGVVYSVSLLQLSTEDKVYLFRLNKCGFGESLCRLLADQKIVKIGVAIRDDIKHLQRIKKFMPSSFVELQDFAPKYGIEDKAFSKLMAIILGVRISKRQRTSNWDSDVLSEAQIRYAATDAWGSLKMYQHLTLGH